MTALRLAAPPRDGSALRVTPGVDEVRAMVGRHGQVCLSHTFLADCETALTETASLSFTIGPLKNTLASVIS